MGPLYPHGPPAPSPLRLRGGADPIPRVNESGRQTPMTTGSVRLRSALIMLIAVSLPVFGFSVGMF